MKKFIWTILIIFTLSSTCFFKPVYAINLFKEGIYKVSDFNPPQEDKYTVQNSSSENSVLIQVYNNNLLLIQSIKLIPSSEKYKLIELLPDYKIVIIGDGEVYIS
ncbi:hypothetical protein [Clostridium septicum]|uniref:Uncharacterized protein n=1 Tax=Clostridium septicum TaxID=1504 RepID=A0A9N7JNH9_CLOSE|nr:hypothetical protein [Clostridium septicum]AYE35718.1 hypothetical protein CP523_15465 [Clostridium septicum]MDU1314919.1 hypothetical protein [Clostridium septicum]QAS61058.1 hypothetical protein EI377_10170 [Clostridium septicum]UEC19607.1 hypothetical protein LK444_09230 [Clostridium septicum]USS02334.1 hypothetical protein NH397_07950 [Clostridium septicum]